ncbi:uncharacterized protein RBU33_005746 [Hipposideros larvatus]
MKNTNAVSSAIMWMKGVRYTGAEGHEVCLGRALPRAHPLPPLLRVRPAPHRAGAHQRGLPRPAHALSGRRRAPQRGVQQQREHQQAGHRADGDDQVHVHIHQSGLHARGAGRRQRGCLWRLAIVHQRQQHGGGGHQCRLAVVLHQHQQAMARRVRLVQGASRTDLTRVQTHAERDARAPCRLRQLIRQPRVVA